MDISLLQIVNQPNFQRKTFAQLMIIKRNHTVLLQKMEMGK